MQGEQKELDLVRENLFSQDDKTFWCRGMRTAQDFATEHHDDCIVLGLTDDSGGSDSKVDGGCGRGHGRGRGRGGGGGGGGGEGSSGGGSSGGGSSGVARHGMQQLHSHGRGKAVLHEGVDDTEFIVHVLLRVPFTDTSAKLSSHTPLTVQEFGKLWMDAESVRIRKGSCCDTVLIPVRVSGVQWTRLSRKNVVHASVFIRLVH